MASPPLNIGSQINGNRLDNEQGHSRKPSLGFSDHDGEDNEEDYHHGGDYSTRMEELFEDGDDDPEAHDDDDEEEGFLYTGVDADESTGDYRSQLRDVLGPDLEEDEEQEVERSLLHEVDDEKLEFSLHDVQVSPATCYSCCSTASLTNFMPMYSVEM
jgi:hypothetical protein